MFPLLKLHGTAAQRGDGLRPELLDALRRETRPSQSRNLTTAAPWTTRDAT